MSYNDFSGTLPLDMGNSLPNLERLLLSHRRLSGQIPSSITNASKLIILDMSANSFSGSIPDFGRVHFFIGGLRVSARKYGILKLVEALRKGVEEHHGFIFIFDSFINVFKIFYTLSKLFKLFPNILRIRESKGVPTEIFQDLNIANASLTGDIPSSIFNMSSLTYLSFSLNSLSGTIPTFRNLPKLEKLYLYNNNLTGETPTSITNASQLDDIYLSSNSFTSPVPDFDSPNQEFRFLSSLSNCRNLTFLDISNNPMMNGILPASVGNFSTSLSTLAASNCSIRGIIPHEIGNLRHLEVLDLSKNQITGFIPTTFQMGCNLMSLNLNVNKLEGSLPQSICNCHTLQVLDIGNNRIHGTFPVWTGNLSDLRVLILTSNNFSGTISSHTSKAMLPFPNLQVFDVSHHEFAGNLPHEYLRNFKGMVDVQKNHRGHRSPFYTDSLTITVTLTVKGIDREYKRILKTMTTIDMSSYRFSGSIPNIIGNLNSLIYLNLSHNCLIGGIPASLGNVTELESLDLSSNQLEGEIPT
ncbi:receptor-like protein 36 [Salvia hispanica]|uniref:receptor-like protein 36 n=1 Tax=Salvia hispanica TaxID=49212 RepID=UPI0020098DC0|nr:receptor-like protein 36 [Salvia hispanica]